MSEVKEKLVSFILKEDLSSIQLMSRRLGISKQEIREALDELVGDGKLIGYISKDEERFFRHDLKQPVKESKAVDDYSPESNGLDVRPGYFLIFIGIIILSIGSLFYYVAVNQEDIDLSSLMMFVGLVALLLGCYWVSRRRSLI
jgi:hypothetical protein